MTPLALVTRKNCCWAIVGKAATVSWNWLPGWQSALPQVSVAETFVFETVQVCPGTVAAQAVNAALPFCRTAVTEPPARMLSVSVAVQVLLVAPVLEQLTLATLWASTARVPPAADVSAKSAVKAMGRMTIRDQVNMFFFLSIALCP